MYDKYKVGDRLICIANSYDSGITKGRVYKIVRYTSYAGTPYIYVRNDNNIVLNYDEHYFIVVGQYLGGCLDGVVKSVDHIPDVLIEFNNMFAIVMYQDEYGIWNSDGGLNIGRFNIFKDDYNRFLHKEYLESLIIRDGFEI